MEIGKAIRKIRIKRGYSQVELAKLMGRTPTMVSLIETGKNIPQSVRLKEVCDALGIHMAFLLLFSIEKEDLPKDKQVLYDSMLVPLRDALIENQENVD